MVAFYAFWGTNRRNFSSMPSQKGITETWWDNSHDWWIMVDGSRLLHKERWKRRRRGGVKCILCAKENLMCLEVNCSNCKTPIESLWVKIRKGSYSGHLLPNQNYTPKKVIIGSLKQVLRQQNLAFMVTSTTQKNHVTHQAVMCRMLLPHTRYICQQGMNCHWASHSQTKRTCFVVSRFMMALAALITIF